MKIRRSAVLVLGLIGILLVGGVVLAAHHGGIMIHIDGKHIETDVAPQLMDGRTLVPIRFIAENFGADVDWVSETGTVEITSPAKKFADNFMDKGMYQTDAAQAMVKVAAGQAVILDVRPPAHRAQGYVEDSMHVPLPMIPERMDEFKRGITYMIYCVMDTNSAFAAAMLNMAGIDAYVVSGGMDALLAAGAGMTVTAIVQDDEEDEQDKGSVVESVSATPDFEANALVIEGSVTGDVDEVSISIGALRYIDEREYDIDAHGHRSFTIPVENGNFALILAEGKAWPGGDAWHGLRSGTHKIRAAILGAEGEIISFKDSEAFSVD